MSILFTPKSISKMVVKNRFVRSPTGDKRATPDGKCTDSMVDFYKELADGGVGLIITGAAYVLPNGQGLPNMIGLHTDEVIEGYRELTRAVHAYQDVKIFSQLWHCGRHIEPNTYDFATLGPPIAPSPVKDKVTGVTPREMTENDIQHTIDAFAQAARRTKEAEFDGIEFHGAHGYLIHEFLSPYTNRRTDRWGGSFEKSIRFLLEIYERVREAVGDDYPITIKINAEDYQEGGITIDLSRQIAEKLSAIGIDAIELSAGIRGERHFNMARGDIPRDYFGLKGKTKYGKRKLIKHLKAQKDEVKFKENYLLPFAKEIKKVIDIPLILPGGLRTVRIMEEILQNGDTDFIGLCRPLIRDPEFPNKVRKGLKKSDCLNCNRCLVDKPVTCYQKLYRPPHF